MKKIFVVEDDHDIRELIGFLLMSSNYEVKTFASADAFQEELSLNHPDLVLLDIMLPDGNGVEICGHLKNDEITRNIPVILMSAHADGTQLADKNANDFIAKPFDVEDLLQRVEKQV